MLRACSLLILLAVMTGCHSVGAHLRGSPVVECATGCVPADGACCDQPENVACTPDCASPNCATPTTCCEETPVAAQAAVPTQMAEVTRQVPPRGRLAFGGGSFVLPLPSWQFGGFYRTPAVRQALLPVAATGAVERSYARVPVGQAVVGQSQLVAAQAVAAQPQQQVLLVDQASAAAAASADDDELKKLLLLCKLLSAQQAAAGQSAANSSPCAEEVENAAAHSAEAASAQKRVKELEAQVETMTEQVETMLKAIQERNAAPKKNESGYRKPPEAFPPTNEIDYVSHELSRFPDVVAQN